MTAKYQTRIVVGALFMLLHHVVSDNYTTGVNMMSASSFVLLAGAALVNTVRDQSVESRVFFSENACLPLLFLEKLLHKILNRVYYRAQA